MATPVGYASAMLLGLVCKLSEEDCSKAALNRLPNLYRADKQTNKCQENDYILHTHPVLSYV